MIARFYVAWAGERPHSVDATANVLPPPDAG
jgi:hypothetical protein